MGNEVKQQLAEEFMRKSNILVWRAEDIQRVAEEIVSMTRRREYDRASEIWNHFTKRINEYTSLYNEMEELMKKIDEPEHIEEVQDGPEE